METNFNFEPSMLKIVPSHFVFLFFPNILSYFHLHLLITYSAQFPGGFKVFALCSINSRPWWAALLNGLTERLLSREDGLGSISRPAHNALVSISTSTASTRLPHYSKHTQTHRHTQPMHALHNRTKGFFLCFSLSPLM